ncbi:ribonuclease Z [Clostridium sp. DSM 100503]|uniref:ribonuclease Z n=1 Tax=Clostridium sp. DSM 100503 TaxID=2963282 RepID=UPI00214A0815|nr:ribonuclease Z [Clostridium sp. DSM 100503]MCR1949635.1 ribonuclease Z [Clostridium sp. DSM 100503]
MIDISLLGCGGGMPMLNRNLSSLFINYKGRKILIDCGEGTQVAIRKMGLGFKAIDLILITHCHGDHIVGLPGLLSTIGNSGRENPLTIIGPIGITNVVNSLRVIAPYLPYDLNIIENPNELYFNVKKDLIELDISEKSDLILKTIELEHSAACLGYGFYFKRKRKFDVEKATKNNVPKVLWNRLQKEEEVIYDGFKYDYTMVLGEERKGIKISFITDTRPTNCIASFIKNSDLFVCEGTYGDDNDIEKAIKNKHMTFREAASLAKNGDVREMLLTHFSPAMLNPNEYLENATEAFSDVIIGEDEITKTLKFTE